VDGLPIYPKNAETIKPDFKTTEPFTRAQIPIDAMMVVDKTEDHSDDAEEYWDISRSTAMLVNYDSISDELRSQPYSFENVVRNQLKYLIQEVVFFDKHTSRLHSKIMAIAPLQADLITTRDSSNVMSSLRESIMFWIPFDKLRPYMAMQYAIPNRNEVKRVTFDEFFQKRLYTSYIVGEGNMYNRWIPDYAKEEAEVKKEQARIATELLNFEQDLWEY
jgi:gliding motility associated protien GldN